MATQTTTEAYSVTEAQRRIIQKWTTASLFGLSAMAFMAFLGQLRFAPVGWLATLGLACSVFGVAIPLMFGIIGLIEMSDEDR